ncbi:Dedicator of cytokinesis protein 4 [Saguinus oedipus]|uniref:Dedicator of cytokinesis protein 4 n=1 Tax=Saguinus oedipus TaxID=9490 RepID=A0ABQ9UHC7_SAGOE|nr:Dedicator of cytokinesis protein 4 [Saguinus oedipus]
MLDLLKWRTHPDKITGCLSKLKEIDGSEIVKFLQDTLDTLFGILDENSQKYGSKVFDSLVHIINLLQDSKFHHFKPVMDTYIESHFAGALAYSRSLPAFTDLIKVLKWYVDRITEAERQEHIQEVLKAQEYIFKYIVQSRRLFSLATGGQNEEEFRCCIQELLMSVRFFLSQESKGSGALSQSQKKMMSAVCLFLHNRVIKRYLHQKSITPVYVCSLTNFKRDFFVTFVVPLDPEVPQKWLGPPQYSRVKQLCFYLNTLISTALDSLSSIPHQIVETTSAASKNHICESVFESSAHVDVTYFLMEPDFIGKPAST